MNRTLRAAVVATVIIGASSAVIITRTPAPLAVLLHIFVMLPLWFIDNTGLMDIGSEKNGFFLPTTIGYVIGAVLCWFMLFLIIRAIWKTKAEAVGMSLK